MENFMKEVEEKLKDKENYKRMRDIIPPNTQGYIEINELIDDIDNWLNEQVDLDLPMYFTRLSYYNYLKEKQDKENTTEVSQEDNKPYNAAFINIDDLISTQPREKYLNVDKIKDLEDVKRVLKFLKIKAIDDGVVQTNGFEDVKDLFE